MKKAWLLIPIVIVLSFVSRSGSSDEDYAQEFEEYLADKHDFFSNSEGSPFVQKDVPYQKVSYFEPNSSYKVNGTLERFTSREIIRLGNSDGTETTYLKFAWVKFTLQGKQCKLLLLKALGFGNQYFLAFGDETSGITTYGAGRYLDVIVGKSNDIQLDFNKAYNPYCAYFDDFTCPLPPVDNLLEIAINAGEKNYPDF